VITAATIFLYMRYQKYSTQEIIALLNTTQHKQIADWK